MFCIASFRGNNYEIWERDSYGYNIIIDTLYFSVCICSFESVEPWALVSMTLPAAASSLKYDEQSPIMGTQCIDSGVPFLSHLVLLTVVALPPPGVLSALQ